MTATNKIIISGAIAALLLGGFSCSQLPISNNKPTPYQKTPVASDEQLNLSNKGLTAVPAYVFDLTSLKELNISNNNIGGAIQAEIRKLEKLEVLDASNNAMTGVPAEIGQLKNLRVLNLSNNKLTGLPYELGNLKNLQTLDLSGNSYSQHDVDIIRPGLINTRIIL